MPEIDDREWQVNVTYYNHNCPYIVVSMLSKGCKYPVLHKKAWDVDLEWEPCGLEECPIEAGKVSRQQKSDALKKKAEDSAKDFDKFMYAMHPENKCDTCFAILKNRECPNHGLEEPNEGTNTD